MPSTLPTPAHLSVVTSQEVDRVPIARADEPPQDVVRTEPTTQPAVGFACVDRLPLTGLVDEGNAKAILTWASEIATALVGDGRDDARLRLIARSIASERARLAILEAMLDEHLVVKNFTVTRELNLLVSSTTRRLCALLREHQASCSNGARAAIVVGHADQVHVDAGK